LFKSWIGCARFVYNKTVEHLRAPGTRADWKAIKGEILAALPEWAGAMPYQIKSIAIKDACDAVKAAKRRYRETGKICEVKFKSRRDARQSCYIPGSAIRGAGIYHTISGNGLRYAEPLPEPRKFEAGKLVQNDARLVFEYGRWTINIPEKITINQPENQGRIVAIDPGVRTFATCFSLDECVRIGEGSFARIVRLAHHLDDLFSRLDPKCKIGNVGARRRHRMREAASRMRAKIRDLVDDLHWQTISRLLDRYDVILLPTFETSQMVTRATRRIRKKSVRAMLTLAHYRFAQRLKWKAEALGKSVISVNEAYTSKTVSWTGEVIANLGGRKSITRNGVTVNRDDNGARGILLRALEDFPDLLKTEICTC